MTRHSALIFSHDPVAAALIGGAAELAGLITSYPSPGEAARDSLRRVRPACVIADCDRDDVSTEAFIGPAMMMGARVVVFCSSSLPAAVARSKRLAQRYDVALFHLPADADALYSYLVALREKERAGPALSGNSR